MQFSVAMKIAHRQTKEEEEEWTARAVPCQSRRRRRRRPPGAQTHFWVRGAGADGQTKNSSSSSTLLLVTGWQRTLCAYQTDSCVFLSLPFFFYDEYFYYFFFLSENGYFWAKNEKKKKEKKNQFKSVVSPPLTHSPTPPLWLFRLLFFHSIHLLL